MEGATSGQRIRPSEEAEEQVFWRSLRCHDKVAARTCACVFLGIITPPPFTLRTRTPAFPFPGDRKVHLVFLSDATRTT